MRGKVHVIYGNNVQSMVQRLLTATGALGSIQSNDVVVIKPNLVVSRRNWQGVNTDPRVVESLTVTLKQQGVSRITIGDGSGMGYNATKAFTVCGYQEMAKHYGLKLVDLERDRFVAKTVTIDGPFRSLEIAQTVLECDVLINVPVMKAHSFTRLTCALKNLKGVMPRALKTRFHSVDLNRAIAQLNSVLRPDLILVDGLQGDLSSETGQTPVAMERLLLGKNPVEVDSAAADMLGYAPRAIQHIAYSADAGLGTCDLNSIEVLPLNQPTTQVHFEPPTHYSRRFPCQIIAEGACCTCMGNLIFALERLQEQRKLSKKQIFLVGQQAEAPAHSPGMTIAIGQCAAAGNSHVDVCIDVCPQHPIDAAFIGIGENAHVAFNDPPADFETTQAFLVVTLDDACRRQQFGEGWFQSLDDVPEQAISMSIQQILKSRQLFVSTPDRRKAQAVQCALEGQISPMCPASILRTHPQCTLFLDPQSAWLLKTFS